MWGRLLRVSVSLAIGGCGRIAFDPLGGGDAGGSDAASACAPWTPATTFTTPVRVVELAGNDEQQPHLSSDGLTIYFVSGRTGPYRIYTAQRSAPDQPFANVRQLTEVNSANDTAFAPAPDQLTAYLSSDRAGPIDLWISRRNAATQPWGTPSLFASSTAFVDYDPFVSVDGLRLYWAIVNWNQGVGLTDVVVATRPTVADSFGPPSLLGGLATTMDEDNPSETADGRMLVFSSNRGGAGSDIYYATRATTAAAYASPSLVPGVNQPGAVEDSESFVTPEGCQLWFVSNRAGNYNIYVADVMR